MGDGTDKWCEAWHLSRDAGIVTKQNDGSLTLQTATLPIYLLLSQKLSLQIAPTIKTI